MLRFCYSIIAILAFSLMSFAGTKGTESTKNAPDYSPKGDLQISVFQNTEDHRYIVSFRNETLEPVELSVEDVQGNTIYTESVDGMGIYNKRFDLVNLNNGEYTVTVGNKFNTIEKELVIK